MWPDVGSLNPSVVGGHPCRGAASIGSQSLPTARRASTLQSGLVWVVEPEWGEEGTCMGDRLKTRFQSPNQVRKAFNQGK